jgi:hypothetical protein
MIFSGKARRNPDRMIRVAQYLVEVNHTVKGAAGPYPLVDLPSNGFLCVRIISGNREIRSLKWNQRASDLPVLAIELWSARCTAHSLQWLGAG